MAQEQKYLRYEKKTLAKNFGTFTNADLKRATNTMMSPPTFHLAPRGPCQKNEKWPNSGLKLNEIHEHIKDNIDR